MKTRFANFLAVTLLFCFGLPLASRSAEKLDKGKPAVKELETAAMARLPVDYRIGPGDVMQIVVWKEPEASVPAVIVRADGNISIPLVKEIKVQGLTPTDLEKLLAERLSRLIHGADVTVIVREVHSQKAYLIGAVSKTGAIELRSPMTVLQAIAEAGGVTEYAKKKQIYILRVANGKQVRLPVNYEAVIRGQKADDNILIQPNDTIVVPQ